MDEAKRQLIRGWMTKARNDLATARQLAVIPDAHLDTAIYHCQQAAEKGLKAILARHDQRPERTHDLVRLLNLAAPFEPSLATLQSEAQILTPYATAYRYPDDLARPEPARDEFTAALAAAGKMHTTIAAILPAGCLP